MMRSRVLAENTAGGIDNLALRVRWINSLLLEISVDERGIVAVGHEADLLAIVLFGDRQAEFLRQLAHFGLIMPPRGNSVRASCVCVSPKRKYVWSFAGIDAGAHLVAPVSPSSKLKRA